MMRKGIGLITALVLANALLPVGSATAPTGDAGPAAPAAGGVVINEVLYNPAGYEPGAEAVELHNPTPFAVNLTGWTLSDDDGQCNPPNDAIALNGSLAPGAVAVVTIPASPRCVTLSNSGDVVILTNAAGAVADAVCWGGDCSDHPGATAAPGPVDDGLSVQRCLLVNSDGSPALGALGAAEFYAAAPTLGASNGPCLG